ncbi:MAG: porin family protein [Bacteroidota bacterium]
MKQEDELFDEFLRKKGNDANIQFTESDWIMAKDMIANDRLQKKNRKRFFLLFLTMLFIAFISAVTWNHVMSLDATDNNNATVASSSHSTTPANNSPATNTTPSTNTANNNAATINTKDKNNTTEAGNDTQEPNKQQTAVNVKDYKTRPDKTNNMSNTANSNNSQSRKYKKLASAALANGNKLDVASPAEKEALIEEQNSDYLLMDSKKLAGFNVQLNTCDTCVQEKSIAYKIYKKQKQRAQQQVWLEAGLTYYNPNNAWYNPIDFYAGLKYQYFMGAKTFLSSGIYYSRINQNQQERIITEKTYSFGVNENIKKLRTTRLDYIEIPLMLGYCITPKHSVQAGISFMYVIESAEVLKTTLSKESNKERTDYLNGYRNHINDIDWQINLSYQYYLRQNWLINTGFYYGLTNVSVTDNNNNIGLRLGGAYKF